MTRAEYNEIVTVIKGYGVKEVTPHLVATFCDGPEVAEWAWTEREVIAFFTSPFTRRIEED